VAPAGAIAERAVEAAEAALRAVFEEKRPPAPPAARDRTLAWPDRRFLSDAVRSLFRWWGWLGPIDGITTAERLLLAVLMDSMIVPPACRVWARMAGRGAAELIGLGDAPGWTAKTNGFKRLAGGRAVAVDPWRLFPDWFRAALPDPPGDAPPKVRRLELLATLQRPPTIWLRAQGPAPARVWDDLRERGVKPWIHRRLTAAARLEPGLDVTHLPPYVEGRIEIQDLAAQAVGHIANPDPGTRWWVPFAGRGGEAQHLAALMGGKGVVVATDPESGPLRRLALRARRGPYRNLTTKSWGGRHVAGKPASFDGVLVTPPSSGIGTWRRQPEGRWLVTPSALGDLARRQATSLAAASAGVRVGGLLLYAVPTLNPVETTDLVRAFVHEHAGFRTAAFRDPLTDAATSGTTILWPHETDAEGWFVARLVREA
jgi:16S rRNA (cytosine967-C5)-methyltransferase